MSFRLFSTCDGLPTFDEYATLDAALQAAADMLWDKTGTPTGLIVTSTQSRTAGRSELLAIAEIRNRDRAAAAEQAAMEDSPAWGSF